MSPTPKNTYVEIVGAVTWSTYTARSDKCIIYTGETEDVVMGMHT